jgi:hypothetical protein
MSEHIVERRKALKYLGMLAATAAGREFLAGWLPSASTLHSVPGTTHAAAMPGMHHAAPQDRQPAQAYTPQFFKPREFETVELLTEMIIPTDDKPGAREARVADYIDFVVFSAAEFRPMLQEEWTKGLALLDRLSKEKHGAAFRQISGPHREELLMEMSLPERDPLQKHPGHRFYLLAKDMTVEGFYSSRVGLIGALEYQGLTYLNEFPGCTHPEHQS